MEDASFSPLDALWRRLLRLRKSRLGLWTDAEDECQKSGGAIEFVLPVSRSLRGLSRRRGNSSDSDLTIPFEFFEIIFFRFFDYSHCSA